MIASGAARASRAPVAGLGYLQDQVEDTDEQQQVEEDAHQITSRCEVEEWKGYACGLVSPRVSSRMMAAAARGASVMKNHAASALAYSAPLRPASASAGEN